VLVSYSGGASPGGMQLTDRARDAIRRYRCVTEGLQEMIAERFAPHLPTSGSSHAEVPTVTPALVERGLASCIRQPEQTSATILHGDLTAIISNSVVDGSA
jgi:hypothetical protein